MDEHVATVSHHDVEEGAMSERNPPAEIEPYGSQEEIVELLRARYEANREQIEWMREQRKSGNLQPDDLDQLAINAMKVARSRD